MSTILTTRFPELGYTFTSDKCWRFVDIDNSYNIGRTSCIGPCYRSKTELLADLERYARQFGCDGTLAEPTGSVQEMGWRDTALGLARYIRIFRDDDKAMSWEEVYSCFAQAYPECWAVQMFPPVEELVNEANVYHLFVLEGEPKGMNIKRK